MALIVITVLIVIGRLDVVSFHHDGPWRPLLSPVDQGKWLESGMNNYVVFKPQYVQSTLGCADWHAVFLV